MRAFCQLREPLGDAASNIGILIALQDLLVLVIRSDRSVRMSATLELDGWSDSNPYQHIKTAPLTP